MADLDHLIGITLSHIPGLDKPLHQHNTLLKGGQQAVLEEKEEEEEEEEKGGLDPTRWKG